MSTLAIDIGGTKIALAKVKNGQVEERRQVSTPRLSSPHDLSRELMTLAAHWLTDCTQIGIATTGWVTPQGITAINTDTLDFPAPFGLAQALFELSDLPVSILNDAQAAAWFEYQQLPDEIRNMAYITVSTGVGGGLVINGELHQGASGLAGHLGHMSVDGETPCGCGRIGCVEAIASGTAIARQAAQCFESPPSNIELFEAAANQPQAEAIIERSAAAIGQLCCNLKAALDLDQIILGGGVGLAQGYLARVQRYIEQQPQAFRVKINQAHGGNDACLLGAACFAEERARND